MQIRCILCSFILDLSFVTNKLFIYKWKYETDTDVMEGSV